MTIERHLDEIVIAYDELTLCQFKESYTLMYTSAYLAQTIMLYFLRRVLFLT